MTLLPTLLQATQPTDWRSLTTAQIFLPVGQPPELIPGLGYYRGSVALVVAAGYSGKTMILQACALAAAAGSRAWGVAAAASTLRIAHIDLEQGPALTCSRYQKLARGQGITEADLGDRLVLHTRAPDLSKSEAKTDWANRLAGADLVLVDSLRVAAATIDENDSKMRGPLDALNQIAVDNNQAIVVIHHTRKGVPDAAPHEAIRGSSAIFDAVTSAFILTKGKDGRVLTPYKDRWREPLAPLQFEFADTAGEGLLITARREAEQEPDTDDVATTVLTALLERGPQPSVAALQKWVSRRRDAVARALRELVTAGAVIHTHEGGYAANESENEHSTKHETINQSTTGLDT